MDSVRLKNMQFFAHHGASREEAEVGQRFEVDVELAGSLRYPAKTDDHKDTYDYDQIYQIVNETVTGSRFKLIERLAEEIARGLLDVYPGAKIKLTVRKPHLPVPGVLDGAEVEIVRGPRRKTIRSAE